MRIKIIKIITVTLFAVVALDLAYLQLIRGDYYHKLSLYNRIRVVPLEARRGRILDRNNVVLADNKVFYNAMVIPQEIDDKQELFGFLAPVLWTDARSIEAVYRRNKLTPFTPVVIAEDITSEQAIKIEEEKYRLPGLLVQQSFRRTYPLSTNSAHVLGYVAKADKERIEKLKGYGYSPQSFFGYSGVEEYYDSYLRGEEGGLQVEINSRGQQVRLLGMKDPVKGQDIKLTIDSNLQNIIADSLLESPGAVVVMDLDSGEILGLANYPSYDPNVFLEPKARSGINSLFNNPQAPLLNRAINGLYPPGSTFKVPVAFAALNTKKITPHTTFICKGSLDVGGTVFGCSHVHGTQDLIQAIANSCNVYFFHVGLILGADTMARYARLFGLGELTYIDLPYEAKGNIPSRQSVFKKRRWYTGDTVNMSIGQGEVLATPLQMLKVIAIVARDGELIQPRVIKSIGGKEAGRYKINQRLTLEPDTFQIVKKGLRAAVTEYSGTAHVLAMDNLFVAGKTGTAQSREGKEPHAWFAGYALGKKKNIAFCVFLENGGSSQNACLVARQIILKMLEKQML